MKAACGIIGVLALQGAFREHRQALGRLGVESREVRLPGELKGISALIIPGGESITIGKLLVEWELLEAVRRLGRDGLPIWGTCAGAVVMAEKVEERGRLLNQPLLRLLPMTARRNAFGRQRESFEADLAIRGLEGAFRGIFIRAPLLLPEGPEMEVLAEVDGEAVFVRDRHLMATSFHPELTRDDRIHELFLT